MVDTDWNGTPDTDVNCPIIAPVCLVTVSEQPVVPQTVTVSFSLLGDTLHGEGGTVHTNKAGNLTAWLAAESYTLDAGSTVKDLLDAVEEKYSNVTFNATASQFGTYIESVTFGTLTLAEFDNGPLTGWMYTVNGSHPDVSVDAKTLQNGDVVVFHYTDDYTKEEGSEEWSTPDTQPVSEDKNETENSESETDAPETVKFSDVEPGSWYEEAVSWAVQKGITEGMGDNTFAPEKNCTRAQMVTFLWRACGKPEPEAAVCKFADVDADSYYYKAVLWAVEQGITNGVDDTRFAPDAECTRGQMTAFLYRCAKAEASEGTNPFADVAADSYYYEAVLWAAENGVTKGMTETTFAPAASCTRGQMVTFLCRWFGK